MFPCIAVGLLCIPGWTACATATQAEAVPSQTQAVPAASLWVASQPEGGFEARLAENKVSDGGLIFIEARKAVGAGKADGRDFSPLAKYGEMQSAFFPIDPKPTHWGAVLAVPYETLPGLASVRIEFGQEWVEIPFEVRAGDYKSEVLTVAPEKVEPPARHMARIRREIEEVNRVYRLKTEKRLWNGPFRLPVQSAVTSEFGARRVYNGKTSGFHKGLDLRAKTGTPIRAPAGGVVALAKDLYFTGYTVIIDHGFGVFTLYAHMSRLKVKKGQRVNARQLLGLAGMTGRSTGPHLHWGASIQNVKINPMDLTRVMR